MFPYDAIAPYQNWRKAVTSVAPSKIDPQVRGRFVLTHDTRIASAGSCFAQRISESLQEYGFKYYVAEPGPNWLSDSEKAAFSYGVYSARYGNIYTTLGLLQLLQRMTGEFKPVETVWKGKDGEFLDPFRPSVQPGGFSSVEELEADRSMHLRAVKRMFEEIDVFVFTLGLTETFCHREDDSAYPVCPGRGIGEFDERRYYFRNLDVDETSRYLEEALLRARESNPQLRVILTVSPVPLAATMEDRHVIASTTYSKAVLRIAADRLARKYDWVDYFASYEIVTATYNNGGYFDDTRRAVTEGAVHHVMTCFYRHYAGLELEAMQPVERLGKTVVEEAEPCDEDKLLAHINADFS